MELFPHFKMTKVLDSECIAEELIWESSVAETKYTLKRSA